MSSLTVRTKLLVVAGLFAIAGCGDLRSREEFVTLVKDKSTAEVRATIGKPAEVAEDSDGTIRWTYNSRTFNTDAGTQFDKKTIVVFRKSSADASAKMVDVVYE
jgi:hypothetical protein